MGDPIDVAGPWTIKSFPTQTRAAITKAAKQEGLTVGQWLEKRVNEWIEDGSPVDVETSPVDLVTLAALADSARAMAAAAGVAPPAALARHLLALTSAQARIARGLKSRKPRALPAPERDSDDPNAE